MQTGRTRAALAGAVIVLAWGLRATAAMPRGPAAVAPTAQATREAAQRHLRVAREHLAASCEMLKNCDRHAVDGYYVACQEAWNAAWTLPEDRDLLIDAADAYADALAGLLEAARRHQRLGNGGLWVGPRGRPVLVPFRPQALAVDPACIASIEPQAQSDD